MYFVYMIRNSANALYVGVTKEPEKRLEQHNTRRGAGYTKRIPTFSIVFLETHESLAGARIRELQIKKWRREKKETLVQKYKSGLETRQ